MLAKRLALTLSSSAGHRAHLDPPLLIFTRSIPSPSLAQAIALASFMAHALATERALLIQAPDLQWVWRGRELPLIASECL